MSKLTFADGKEYEPNDVYLVTAIFNGRKVYGQAKHNNDEAKANWEEGLVLVEDAFTPSRYLILAKDVTPIEMNMGTFNPATEMWDDYDEVHQHVQDESEKQTKFDDETFDKFIVGRSFSVGVADGSANYVITKINKKTVLIEWRGMCSDRWTDRLFGWGGSFRREDIERMVTLHKPLFGKR